MIEFEIPFSWETIESFDFSNIITQQDHDLCMQDVRQLVADKKQQDGKEVEQQFHGVVSLSGAAASKCNEAEFMQ